LSPGFVFPVFLLPSQKTGFCSGKAMKKSGSISFQPLINDAELGQSQPRKACNKSEFYRGFLVGIATFIAIGLIFSCFPQILRKYHNYKHAVASYDWSEKLHDLEMAFKTFEEEFDRQWHNKPEERAQRFQAFRKTFYKVRQLNSVPSNTTFELNEFSDWTEDEIKQFLMPLDHYERLREDKFIRPLNPVLSSALTDEYPAHLDWRDKGVVTPVKAQGKCGSCWAFATAATVESAYAVAHGELRSLSEQELLDCNLENNACNGGNVGRAFSYVHEHGLMLEDDYPYVAHRQNSCALAGQTTKIDTAYYLDRSEKDMVDWLVNFGPVNVGISVTPDMMPYKNGVFRPSDFDCKYNVLGLHALLVVGYGETEEGEKYWIIKNSWGQNWGTEHGYVYFARGVNACGIEDEPIGILA
jgi:C1A family cysteine protease